MGFAGSLLPPHREERKKRVKERNLIPGEVNHLTPPLENPRGRGIQLIRVSLLVNIIKLYDGLLILLIK